MSQYSAESVKLWLEALRSGNYKQGHKKLCQGDKFCCLGVACDLYQKHVGGLKIDIDPSDVKSYNEWTSILPIQVKEWLGLSHLNGSFDKDTTSLSHLNDNGTTFKQIADIIESRPNGLFETVA